MIAKRIVHKAEAPPDTFVLELSAEERQLLLFITAYRNTVARAVVDAAPYTTATERSLSNLLHEINEALAVV